MRPSQLPIRYRDFYDVPRAILVQYGGALYFFDCPFSDALDEYGDEYSVYRLRQEPSSSLDDASWEGLPGNSEYLGSVPVKAVAIDSTRRRSIDAGVCQRLGVS